MKLAKMRGILQLLVLNDNVFNTKLLLDWVNLKIQQTKGKIRHHTDKFHVKVTHVVLYRVTPVRANLYDNDNPTNSHKKSSCMLQQPTHIKKAAV